MATWKRWANLIAFFVLLLVVIPIDKLAGFIAFLVMIFGLIALYSLLGGRSQSHIPLGALPIAYSLIRITPMIEYLLLIMNLRRSAHIRAFLRRADNIRMRKQSIHCRFPRRPS
jgi:hypothetical protein